MATEKENDMIKELINFSNLLSYELSSKYRGEFHGITDNDYGANQDIINNHLLDLILILILFKKNDPSNDFFSNDVLLDSKKNESDEAKLCDFLNEGNVKGLVYDRDVTYSSTNFILICWRILVTTEGNFPKRTIKIGVPTDKNNAANYLKSIINSFTKNDLNENIASYIDKLVSSNSSKYNSQLEHDEQHGLSYLLDSMLNKNDCQEVCFDPGLLSLNHKNKNIHFLVSTFEIDIGLHHQLNHHFIKANALNVDLKSILAYSETKNITPNWGNSESVKKNPIIIYNPENHPKKFDLVALEFKNTLDFIHDYPHPQGKDKLKSKPIHLINELERFYKLLKNDGQLLLVFNKHVLNRHRKKLEKLFKRAVSVINLKRKYLIILGNNPNKNVKVFNAETLNTDIHPGKKRYQIRADYKIITKEYHKETGDYWRVISRNQLLDECKNSFNFNKFFLPEIKGVPLNRIAKVLKTEKIKPSENDIIINVSSLGSIPGVLDLEKKAETSRKRIPSCLKVEKSCLLIGLIGNKLKPTEFIYEGFPIYLMPGVTPLEINESITSLEFILYALRSEETKAQLKYISSGSYIPRFNIKDVLDLKVNCPNNEFVQKTIINERKESVFGELELDKLLKETQKERFKKIRRISHDMGDYLSNIFPNIDMILESVYSKNEKDINKFFNDDDLNLIEKLKILQNDINSLSILNSQFKEDLDFAKKYPLKMYTALEIYKLTLKILKSYKSKLFSSKVQLRILDLLHDENQKISNKDFNNFEYDKLGYKLNDDAYERFIRQFLRNTEKHAGFLENDKTENKFIIRFDFDELNLNLIIMNNGKPFPKNWTKERFVQHGETTNFKNGNGDGGEIINDICSYFQINDWTLEMNNDDNFPVKFKFPLSLEPI